MIHDPLKCNATGKKRYPTPGDAKRTLLSKLAHNKYKKRSKKAAGKSSLKRYYHCSYCKGFHLTSANYVSKTAFDRQYKEFAEKSKGLIISQEEALDWKKDSLPFPKL